MVLDSGSGQSHIRGNVHQSSNSGCLGGRSKGGIGVGQAVWGTGWTCCVGDGDSRSSWGWWGEGGLAAVLLYDLQ